MYNGHEQEVSKSVQKAYRNYGNKEFGTKNAHIHKDNMKRHVKLINITDKEVNFSANRSLRHIHNLIPTYVRSG